MALPKTETFTDSNFVALETHDAGWTQVGGGTPKVDIYNNGARLDTASYQVVGARWTGDTFNADQSSEATVKSIAAGASIRTGVFVRGSGTGTGFTGYVAWVYSVDSKLYVYEFDGITNGGAGGANLSGALNTIVANDVIKIWAEGSNIHASVNGTECTGSPWTSSDISGTSTSPGFIVSDYGTPQIDDWTGDNFGAGGGSAKPAYYYAQS